MAFKNNLYISSGIYTISDVSKILKLPYQKVHTWVNKYWDGILASDINELYSVNIASIKTINFHALIEFYILYLMGESGVRTRKVLDAHVELSQMFHTKYPFAKKNIIENIKTDGYRIYFNFHGSYLPLDGTKQFNLDFIDVFFKSLEFNEDFLVSKFWPRGKKSSIVLDPEHQLGQPVINKTNILPQSLYNLYKGGESVEFIASLYDIDEKSVRDAIDFCKSAA
ncbi:DUF433 domain-containing protein [uncultured Proteiniphilum sp.]|uniref:DUF433 domain-containing protein n=1 Tax=uncultured Proteiniphilum sp. TaxID=497637 RepID=UPI00260B2445|nr:DUF433 domain-containing protein [uncultured Proteiniphilum sp.]